MNTPVDRHCLRKYVFVKEASVIFYGTARMGEALAIVIRFVQEDFKPTQRLIQLEVLAKALKGVELAQRLMSCLAVKCNFGPNTIIGGIRDGASVNGAALRQLKFFYSNLFDVVCFSHTIDNVGNHFEFRILDSFTQYWVSLFAHSFNARLLWKEKTGQAMRTHSRDFKILWTRPRRTSTGSEIFNSWD